MKNIWNEIKEIRLLLDSDMAFLLMLLVSIPLLGSQIIMTYRFIGLRSTVIQVNQCYMAFITAKTPNRNELAKCINGVQ